MGNDLMPEKVKVDPIGSRSTFRTTEHTAVEGASLEQVMDGKGQVKTRSVRHDLNSGKRVRSPLGNVLGTECNEF